MSPKQILPSEAILEKYGKALAGKAVLITGVADNSIAGELALQVSSADPKLLILSARAESRVAPIMEKVRTTKPNVATRFLKMDLSDLSTVRKAAESDLADVPQIDHLVCLAGVMGPPYSQTKDGLELQFGVNYVANFLLVKLLLPKVRAAGPSSSVVVMSSSVVRTCKVHFEDIGFSNGETYHPVVAYGQSNVARVMFVKQLAKKMQGEGIRIFSIDPGAVLSGLQRHFPAEFVAQVEEMKKAGPAIDADGRRYDYPPWTGRSEGAATVITGMIDPTIAEYNGAFLNQNAVANDELHAHINDENNWTRLWALTEELIHEEFSL
ncbi:Short-chain dehydrogenase/reductase SDR [Penicillium alfredii]|uniref:Short-chain dehydrogenase/reductase SDR n=1 Tax=Penicillium alfredii TaxID=1506179 RepID=A0A9W9K3J5_9EURO|nr:Short-chain dehydrogenase/reductase SDR [Penicillium alfredii]KAJ5091784.1 Short-chain dehydrogenase/reductase SDR [Penicillium alfredii]